MDWRDKFKWHKGTAAVNEDVKVLKAYFDGKDAFICARVWNNMYHCDLTPYQFERMACDLGYKRLEEDKLNYDYGEG